MWPRRGRHKGSQPQEEAAEREQTPAEAEPKKGDELEESPLVGRLRTMQWPEPPPGARERCLDAILSRAEELKRDRTADGEPPAESGEA